MKQLSYAIICCLSVCLLSLPSISSQAENSLQINTNQDGTEQHIGFRFTEKGRSVKIPIKTYHNLILIPVRINNSMEMNFILDTGVKTTIFTEPLLAEFLSLGSTRKINIIGLGEGDAIQASVASNLSISLPEGIEGKGMSIVILPENTISFSSMFGQPVYGIIGYEIFKHFVIEIDYYNSYIRLYKPNKYKVKKGTIIPIQIEHTKPYIETTVIAENGTEKTRLLIDTGASQAISLWHEDVGVPLKTIDAFLGQGLSGNIFGRLGRIKGFQIGEFHFENVVAAYPEASSLNMIRDPSEWQGNLGAAILKRFSVTFDYSNSRIILRKNANYNKPFTYNISGIELLVNGPGYKEYEVTHIRKGSPAEKAGLMVGDLLLAVNSFKTYNSNIGEIYSRLNRKAGKKVYMKFMRKGEVFKKCMHIKEQL
ncbi:MAG: aspartyl protease family protein [Chitinophagales bacterium]